MIAAFLLVLAQGLVIDGTRYHVAEDGRLQATRVADGQLRYRWWPDPPAVALTGKLAAGKVELNARRRTVLAGGIGAAPGMFALDVTDDQQAEAAPLRVLVDDDAVGLVAGTLVVARLGPQARPFVLGSTGAGARRPGLLLLPLDGPGRFVVEVHSPGATLGGVAVARHVDGRALYAYAGDSLGRLWRFDLTGEVPWSQPKVRKPLFSATRADGTPQAISVAPAVMFGPAHGYLVAFGSSGEGANSLYAFHDRLGKPRNAHRDELVRRRAHRDGDGLRIAGGAVDYGRDAGWDLDLACGEGERMAGLDATGGLLVASTSVATVDGCSYALVPLTGLAPEAALTGKRTDGAAASLAELVAVGPADILASTPVGKTLLLSYRLGRRDGDGKLHTLQEVRVQRRFGRLSWRELPHWRALHRSSKETP
jgi:type IV pilus assembly protein PilY1